MSCRLLYPWYALDRRLGGPQSWSGCMTKGERNPFYIPARIQALVILPIT